MKKLIFGLILIIFLGCGDKVPKQPERLPEDEVPAFREAAIKMTKYIVLEDSAYHFTISKEKAVQIGIPDKYYRRMQQELDFTNYTIKEHNRKGLPISFDDYWIE